MKDEEKKRTEEVLKLKQKLESEEMSKVQQVKKLEKVERELKEYKSLCKVQEDKLASGIKEEKPIQRCEMLDKQIDTIGLILKAEIEMQTIATNQPPPS